MFEESGQLDELPRQKCLLSPLNTEKENLLESKKKREKKKREGLSYSCRQTNKDHKDEEKATTQYNLMDDDPVLSEASTLGCLALQ